MYLQRQWGTSWRRHIPKLSLLMHLWLQTFVPVQKRVVQTRWRKWSTVGLHRYSYRRYNQPPQWCRRRWTGGKDMWHRFEWSSLFHTSHKTIAWDACQSITKRERIGSYHQLSDTNKLQRSHFRLKICKECWRHNLRAGLANWYHASSLCWWLAWCRHASYDDTPN